MTHRYHILQEPNDADYIVWESLLPASWWEPAAGESMWIEHTRWMIPGSQMEDA